jgi:hypothetical protein
MKQISILFFLKFLLIMDPLAILKQELDRKRKITEPLREAVATPSADSQASDSTSSQPVEKQEKKKKVYLTNGQARKLQAELTVRVGGDMVDGVAGQKEGDHGGALSPEQISAQKSAMEGKKMIPNSEVFKRLRCHHTPAQIRDREIRYWISHSPCSSLFLMVFVTFLAQGIEAASHFVRRK